MGDLGRTIGTGERELDELLGGGVLESSAVLVHGARGSGKTRLVTRWASRLPCLYVHAELSAPVAAAILHSTGADVRACWLYPQIAGWRAEAERLGLGVVVLDSLSAAPSPADELRQAREWAQAGERRVVWGILHENAQGKAKGGTDAPHWCDYELRLTPGAHGSGVSLVALKKTRLGPTGEAWVPLVPGTPSAEGTGKRKPRQRTS